MEIWRVVPDTNGLYEVSDEGRMRRADKGKVLSGSVNDAGYVRACISIGGKAKSIYVHIFVALAFLGERLHKHDVNHKNGIKTDNRLSNLEYLNRKQHEHHTRNVLKRDRSPVGEKHGNALLTEESVKEIHSLYCTGQYTMGELGKRYGVSLPAVSGILIGHNWKHLNLPKPPKRKYHLTGLDNPKGKVTIEMAEQIQNLHNDGQTVYKLARQFNLGRTTIYRILNRSTHG